MSAFRLFSVPAVLAALACAAGDARDVDQAVRRLDQEAAKAPRALALEFRLRAAQSLSAHHPDLARMVVDSSVEEMRTADPKDLKVGSNLVLALTAVAPSQAAAVIPQIAPTQISMVIGGLVRGDHVDAALALYRDSFSRGLVKFNASLALFGPLAKQKPEEAAKLFQEVVDAIPFEPLDPSVAWWLIGAAYGVSPAAPKLAADTYERILTIVSAKDYGENSPMTATFQGAKGLVTTSNSRDTLLFSAGSRLHALAPDRLEKFKPVLAQWDLSAPLAARSFGSGPASSPGPSAAMASTSQRMSQMRGLPTDADRASLAITLAKEIRDFPAGDRKVSMASGLCSVSTEGDLGKEALTAAATTLGVALHETPGSAYEYLELASLVRYEHLPAALDDPSYKTAAALLDLRERLLQETGFSLVGLDGKTYSLDGLRGHVVLLNFWATWCPPCRREMPDMEKLYQRFSKKGLTVLAVSDEDRDTVAGFIQKQKYTFPVLLDPGREVNTAFNVEGIPKSFIFDRTGKLAAQAIDMRTEAQFLDLLKQAGLE